MIDLDNTLADRAGAVRTWVDEFCATWSLPDDAREWILIEDNDGYSARVDVFAAIKDRFAIDAPVDELLETYRRRVVALNEPMPGAAGCLVSLRDLGWPLAIVSNGSSGQQQAKIDHLGLRELVDAVVVSGELGIKKPDRRIFDAAAAELGLSLDGGWMVGDSVVNDVVGPAAIGLNTAWVPRGRRWPDHVDRPTAIIGSLGELPAIVGRPPAPGSE